jgi:hypothetical protein
VSQSSSCEIHESEVREQAHDASFVLLWIFDRVLPIEPAAAIRARRETEDAVPDRLSELEALCVAQGEALRRLEDRVGALERAAAPGRAPRARAARPKGDGDGDVAQARSDLAAAIGSVSLVGRTLLVLAGGFVLRALTDGGTLPGAVGVGVGLAYAGALVALADRAGRTGTAVSAGFHGASAVMIGFPLVIEAASRFALLSVGVASALIAALTAGALAVAIRRRLHALAWIATLGGACAAGALAVATGRLAAPALVLVLLGVATLWIGYVLDWRALRGPAAAAADLAVAALAVRAAAGVGEDGPLAALAVLLALLAVYLGSISTRTLFLGRGVVPFEAVQGIAALAIGLGGAATVALRSGMGAQGVGAATLALGLAAYGVAFAFVERRQGQGANFLFYASVALLLVISGAALLLPAPVLGFACAALAIAAGAAARRLRRRTLAGHAAAYALVGAAASGLLARAAEALLSSPLSPWVPAPAAAVAVLAAGAATAGLCAGVPRSRPLERAPQLALLAMIAGCAAGVAAGWLVPLVAGAPGAGADAGAVATVRSAVLVATVLGAAALGRGERWAEAGWLAVPGLAAIGLKMLVEDLPRGRPATLVAAFACYGAALIVVPRLRRRRPAPTPAP